MSTIVEFPRNPYRSKARNPFGRQISPHLAGYALVLGLILAILVLGPPAILAGMVEVGNAEVGSAPAPGYAN
jgi:hypothetical protein